MTEAIDLSIIIVTHNTKDLLHGCLSSLGQSGGLHPEIWVVDNASDDASAQMVRSQFPEVNLIVNQENMGFAQANNLALARSSGRYCLLLNPDTTVPAGALQEMVQFMDATPEAGATGCAQVYPDGQLQVTGHRAMTLTREAAIAFGLSRVFHKHMMYDVHSTRFSHPSQVDWVEGGVLLIRRSVLAAIGPMDESFFMYAEDADLCLRIRKANFAIYYLPNVKIIHYRGQASGFEQREKRPKRVNARLLLVLHRSKAQYFRKHFGARQERVYWLLVRVYSLRKLSMSLGAYLLGRLDRRTWDQVFKAYLALLTINWRST